MRIKKIDAGLALWDAPRSRWVSLSAALLSSPQATTAALAEVAGADEPVLEFLSGGAALRADAQALLDAVAGNPNVATSEDPEQLPFRPVAFRDFCLYMRHLKQATAGTLSGNPGYVLQAVCMMLCRTLRLPTTKLAGGPSHAFLDKPVFYMGNHLNFYASGAEVPWPSYAAKLDYELEIAAVLTRDLKDATPAEALAAIGGFVLINDFSARDVQPFEMAESNFGFPKAKNFATAMGSVVVTADELLPGLTEPGQGLDAAVKVNGETWGTSNSADPSMAHGPAEMVAYASLGEQLHAGELLGMGTLPNCCGLEMNKWLSAGDSIELSVAGGLGKLTSVIGERPPMPREGLHGDCFRDLSYRKAGPTASGPSVYTLLGMAAVVGGGLAWLRCR